MVRNRNLEIGGGKHPRAHSSWEQFDMHPWPELLAYSRFHIGDARKLHRFADETFAQIAAHQTLEHFPWTDTVDVLKEWYRVLIPGGLLTLELPDVMGIIKDYTKYLAGDGGCDWAQTVERLYGTQDYEGNAHFAGFTIRAFPRIVDKLEPTAKILTLEPFANDGGFRVVIRKDV